MNNADRFQEYADAFERAFASDHWSPVAEYFAPQAEYVAIDGTRATGSDQIVEAFRSSVNEIDRRFDERLVKPLDPQLRVDGSVFMTWELTFKKRGAPDLRIAGTGEALYEDGKILRLVDQLENGVLERMERWMNEHGSKLIE